MSVLQRIELNFWHLVIPLIRESALVRFTLQRLYSVFHSKLLVGFVLPATLSAALGLSLGYISGVISTFW
ncbi:MAG: hypothetical protein H8D37_00005 [Chloroflexi bacterium]|nr:hypothetical protein [Chloroflexota bacterium]